MKSCVSIPLPAFYASIGWDKILALEIRFGGRVLRGSANKRCTSLPVLPTTAVCVCFVRLPTRATMYFIIVCAQQETQETPT